MTETRVPIRERRQRIYDLSLSALYALNDIGELDELTEASCRAIIRSHMYSTPQSDVPIVVELLATGRLDRIRNDGLRTAIISFLQQTAAAENTIHAVSLDLFKLAHECPDSIQRRVRKDPGNGGDGPVTAAYSCGCSAMKAIRGIMNDLSDNLGRYRSDLDSVFVRVDDRLAELHAGLDAELGLTHPEQAAP